MANIWYHVESPVCCNAFVMMDFVLGFSLNLIACCHEVDTLGVMWVSYFVSCWVSGLIYLFVAM